METKIQKWGNSLGVRIPKQIADKTELREGSCVNIVKKKGYIIIESCSYEKPRLATLVKKITPHNRHGEAEWGKSYGKEIW